MRGGQVRVWLRIVGESPSNFDKTLPLRMMPYKVPVDPKLCFDVRTCQTTDAANTVIEEHNRYITSLLSLFVHQNGCGTSAGHITLPSPPDNMLLTRLMRLQEVFKDKYSANMLAIRYLYDAGKLCEKDYRVEDAVIVANNMAYDKYVEQRKAKGKFRFRIPGTPPTTWDGDEMNRDGFGRRVHWSRGKNHNFVAPEVNVELCSDELIAAEQ